MREVGFEPTVPVLLASYLLDYPKGQESNLRFQTEGVFTNWTIPSPTIKL